MWEFGRGAGRGRDYMLQTRQAGVGFRAVVSIGSRGRVRILA